MRKVALVTLFLLLAAGTASDARAQFCPGVSPWVFDDVLASDPFCGFITKMAQQNVTLGCIVIDVNHRLYCPNDNVTRTQMATFMGRLGDALFPLTCSAGQVMKWNGSQWTCANDQASITSGTVTSVMAGTGLLGSPNPITDAGSLNIAAGYQLPQSCTNGQVAKSTGSGSWVCAADAAGSGTVTSLAQGSGIALSSNPITSTGSIAADTTYLQRRVGTACATGSSIRAIAADGSVTCQTDNAGPANAFVQGGNAFGGTAILGTTDANALDLRVNGTRAMRFEPNITSVNVIGGSSSNGTSNTSAGGTVAGGRSNTIDGQYPFIGGGLSNDATGNYSTIGGGLNNGTSNHYTMIGGGEFNLASGHIATIAGGYQNQATGNGSFIGGGTLNIASGGSAAIPGGSTNMASGDYSLAAGLLSVAAGERSVALGRRAHAAHDGTFVFADNNNFDFSTNVANNFRVRATGGVRFVVDIDGAGNTVWSCGLVAGGSWVCSSDRNQKQDFVTLDGQTVLEKVVAMPVYAWSPKGRNSHLRHYGPTAQDFYAAFGLGDTDLGIGQQDADGVALAAIQGLNRKLESQVAQLARSLEERDARLDTQSRQLVELGAMVDLLLARSATQGEIATTMHGASLTQP